MPTPKSTMPPDSPFERWLSWAGPWMQGQSWPAIPGSVAGGNLAPEQLSQPLNPGWVFGNVSITTRNSGDPETERRITEAVSYGRQLGRMMDALAVLAAQLDPGSLTAEQRRLLPDRAQALADFWSVMAAVRDAKAEARSRWLSEQGMSELAGQLKRLRQTDPDAYAKLAGILSTALGS